MRLTRSTRLLVALAATALCALPGCNACWQVSEPCGATEWNCDSGFDSCGSAEGALILGAIYLAIAIPYLIAEACRECAR